MNVRSVIDGDMARTTGSHSDITGPRIREVALRLFAAEGYAAVSMRKIAAEVGVQAGALYNYTPDKQSLLFDLMHSHMEDLLAARSEAGTTGTPTDRLEAFTRFHISYHEERPHEIFIAYMELRNLTPENFAVIEELRGKYEDELSGILRAGVEAGEFTLVDPRVATRAIISMLNGVTTWYRREGRLTLTEVETIYWDMVRKAVGA
ncbi:transcriptional regulator, TetR family [Donghicola eburneus]|uniref:TetR family transcriptional regulator n=2 Tax=Roseobacteraceae TaxID=2854170 RepID=A0A1M4N248_9RHOB|nr:TetR family transcriptional regulator [Donghicola eburneus]SFQ69091.1 transcriptional regulator, TetR family [Donghicola eburneus]